MRAIVASIAFVASCMLVSCGGGSSTNSSSTPAGNANAPTPGQAQGVYQGTSSSGSTFESIVLPDEAGEVISYGIPSFKYKKLLVWYAAFADHCSLFPTASVIARFKDDLKSYRVSKGTIHFAVDRPLPAALLKKMVNARLSEVAGKERPRK